LKGRGLAPGGVHGLPVYGLLGGGIAAGGAGDFLVGQTLGGGVFKISALQNPAARR